MVSTHEKAKLSADRKLALKAIKYVNDNGLDKTQKVLMEVKKLMICGKISL